MTHPYRTAPLVAPQRPWWRRVLCAVGSHSLHFDTDAVGRDTVVCEHCDARRDPLSLSVVDYCAALTHERTSPDRNPQRKAALDRRFIIHRQ